MSMKEGSKWGGRMMGETYTVQVERMGGSGGVGRGGEGELDGGVDGELVDTSGRQEVLGGLCAAQDLEENWHGGRGEGRIVDREVGAVEVEEEVDGLVDASRSGVARLKQSLASVSNGTHNVLGRRDLVPWPLKRRGGDRSP